MNKVKASTRYPSEGFCDEHDGNKQFRCMDCQSWICGVCVLFNHKTCRTLLVEEALKELKRTFTQEVVNVEIETEKHQDSNMDLFMKDIDEKRKSLNEEIETLQVSLRSKNERLRSLEKCLKELHTQKADRNEICVRLKLLGTSISTAVCNDQFVKATRKFKASLFLARQLDVERILPKLHHCHLSLEVLQQWCQRGSVCVSRCQNGLNQYGMVSVNGGRVFIHCFKPQRPKENALLLSFRDLLIKFNGSSELPRRAFLQVEDDRGDVSDVIIATDSFTPWAINFLLLSSGFKGRSHEGIRLSSPFKETIETSMEEECQAVVKGSAHRYNARLKKGSVCGFRDLCGVALSGFSIYMLHFQSQKVDTKFGFVEKGLDVCEQILRKEKNKFTIKNCGLVI